jgi:hypothetical protein
LLSQGANLPLQPCIIGRADRNLATGDTPQKLGGLAEPSLGQDINQQGLIFCAQR